VNGNIEIENWEEYFRQLLWDGGKDNLKGQSRERRKEEKEEVKRIIKGLKDKESPGSR